MARGDDSQGGKRMSRAENFLRSIALSGISGASSGSLESTGSSELPDRGLGGGRVWGEVDYIAQVLGEQPDEEQVKLLADAGKEGLDRLDGDGPAASLT